MISSCFSEVICLGAMDTTNNRRVQEKSNSNNKTSLRRSVSPTNDTKSNKKLRVSGNTDVREWDLPKLQQQEDKSPTEREVIEEQTGILSTNRSRYVKIIFSEFQ